MKKPLALLLALLLILTLAACGDGSAARKGANQSPTVQDILDAASSSSGDASQSDNTQPRKDPTPPDTAPTPEPQTTSVAGDTVDLTQLSSTLVYSEVYNMMASPEDYVGRTVVMQGAFDVYETPEKNYYACIIADATACCSQGIEFEWEGEHAYPQDYPERFSDITVKGTFETYLENGQKYCHLVHAQLTAS